MLCFDLAVRKGSKGSVDMLELCLVTIYQDTSLAHGNNCCCAVVNVRSMTNSDQMSVPRDTRLESDLYNTKHFNSVSRNT